MGPEDPFAVAMDASDEYLLFISGGRKERDTPGRRLRECYKKEIKDEDAEDTVQSEAQPAPCQPGRSLEGSPEHGAPSSSNE